MGILLCSRTFFAIKVFVSGIHRYEFDFGKFFVTWSYTASHATLSLTFPAVTSTQYNQAVCAGQYVLRTQTAAHVPPYKHSAVRVGFGHRFLNRSSSGTSLIFVIIVIVDSYPVFLVPRIPLCEACSSYTFAALATCSFWNFFLFADALICVPSIKSCLVYHPVVQCFSKYVQNFFTQLRGKRLQKA